MNRFLAFSGEIHEAKTGIGDFISAHETLDAAIDACWNVRDYPEVLEFTGETLILAWEPQSPTEGECACAKPLWFAYHAWAIPGRCDYPAYFRLGCYRCHHWLEPVPGPEHWANSTREFWTRKSEAYARIAKRGDEI